MSGWLTIAKWEFFRSKLKFDLRSLFFLSLFIVLLIAASYAAAQTGMNMNNDIYRVSVTDPNLKPILEIDQRFDVIIVDVYTASNLFKEDTDVVIISPNVYFANTRKSASASDAIKSTLKDYRELVLTSYNDINNTHPVWLTVHYLERPESFQVLSGERSARPGAEGRLPSSDLSPEDIEAAAKGGISGATTVQPVQTPPKTIEEFSQLNRRTLFEIQKIATPSHFSPPIPFTAILYSFLFIFPIYFVSQFYSSSIMDERTNKKCELVLVAPLRSVDIVIGKTLPYLITTMAILAVVTINIKGLPTNLDILKSILLILATMFPIVFLFFALSFFSAILSRSFKELTFAMVFLSVVVSGYLFFPAMFANVHAISTISPMTLIVQLIEGNSIKTAEYIFSTLPFYFVGLSVYGFGTYIFREEDLFTQKPIIEKMLDSIELYLLGPFGSIFLLSIIFIPFVYMAQLMLIVMLFNLPLPYSLLAMMLSSALVEELVKSIGIFTLFKRKMIPLTLKNAVKLAVISGAGFFVGEKLLFIITLAPIATSVFGSVMSMGALLFIPLVIHITGVMIVSLGMYARSVRWYLLLVVFASILHALYNLYILRGVMFG
ncbi:MAG: ABC transporter permease [Methanosarcinaceae archaeon]|nr:ABC transporter permease [Methanosarcinaceae archaeon]